MNGQPQRAMLPPADSGNGLGKRWVVYKGAPVSLPASLEIGEAVKEARGAGKRVPSQGGKGGREANALLKVMGEALFDSRTVVRAGG